MSALAKERELLNAFLSAEVTPAMQTMAAAVKVSVSQFLHRQYRPLLSGRHMHPQIALITSGGTSVPLEKNAVRFVTNFSSGTRGARLTESFLRHPDTAVVLLRHKKSVRPFRRLLEAASDDDLAAAILSAGDDAAPPGLPAAEFDRASIRLAARELQQRRPFLLEVPFDSVAEYLLLLQVVSVTIRDFHKEHYNTASAPSDASGGSSPSWIVILAAAVSDYYLPLQSMSEHKISGGNGLQLALQCTPKALGVLAQDWVGTAHGTVVSFKLETDPNVLLQKSLGNMVKYRNDAVVANLLQSHAHTVTLFRTERNIVGAASSLSSRPVIQVSAQVIRLRGSCADGTEAVTNPYAKSALGASIDADVDLNVKPPMETDDLESALCQFLRS